MQVATVQMCGLAEGSRDARLPPLGEKRQQPVVETEMQTCGSAVVITFLLRAEWKLINKHFAECWPGFAEVCTQCRK